MKTTDLIDMLATEAGPAPRAVAARRLSPALAAGLAIGVAATLLLIGPIPASLWRDPAPWIKLAYAGGLIAGAAWLTARLGRPVARIRSPSLALAAVATAMAAVAALTLLGTPFGERLAVVFGHSWARCPTNVLLLSLPALAGVLWALRGLAPGLAAGGVGAFAYALSCTELSPAFVAVWYSLGVALATALGAMLGPRVLRW
jgi:hypothetical protein